MVEDSCRIDDGGRKSRKSGINDDQSEK